MIEHISYLLIILILINIIIKVFAIAEHNDFVLLEGSEHAQQLVALLVELSLVHIAVDLLLLHNLFVALGNNCDKEVQKDDDHKEGVCVPCEPDQHDLSVFVVAVRLG